MRNLFRRHAPGRRALSLFGGLVSGCPLAGRGLCEGRGWPAALTVAVVAPRIRLAGCSRRHTGTPLALGSTTARYSQQVVLNFSHAKTHTGGAPSPHLSQPRPGPALFTVSTVGGKRHLAQPRPRPALRSTLTSSTPHRKLTASAEKRRPLLVRGTSKTAPLPQPARVAHPPLVRGRPPLI